MNGGFGADGGREPRRPVSGGRDQGRGYDGRGDEGYDDRRGQGRSRPGERPWGDDQAWQQGQPGWQSPQGQQGQPQGPPPGQWPGQEPAQGPGPGQAPGRGQAYGPPQGPPPQYPPPQYPRTGPQPGPRGYDPRGDGRFMQDSYQGWEPGQRDDSFVPGFGAPDGQGGQDGRDGRYGRDDFVDDRDPRRGRRDPGGGPPRHGREPYGDTYERRPRRGVVRRLAPWVALLVIVTPLLIGGLYVYHLYENKYHPADYAGSGTGPAVTVQVNSGDTAFSLGPRLVQLGVVASSRAFELAAEHSTNTTGLEVGFYKLNHHMQASLAYAALLNPKNRVQLTVTIPEGKRASQVILLLAKATSIPVANFQKVIDNPAQLGLPSYAKGKVEGYLFPATYTVEPNETALQILQAMVQRYDVEARQINLPAAARKAGLTSEQVIIEASMVQAEGGSVSDYRKIARVIINRLNDGMKLQFDSVLLYGLNAYAINVTDKQIATPGPYNDFMHAGLPPTPISNPGDAAIQGVLHPAPGPWLYFLTVSGGKSQFSATPLAGQ